MPAAVPHRYTGRFAPSPSGYLHFGSLIAALGSFLDARAHNGVWRVRMEDIDTPRCVPGMDSAILASLEAHGLHWDGDVMYQSQQHDRYAEAVNRLFRHDLAYYCQCSRKQIKAAGGVYPGTCQYKNLGPDDTAVRVVLPQSARSFEDAILGHQQPDDPHALEHTIVRRRDGLYAYNLVVVLDDIEQGVNNIVRGSDLLPTTLTHLNLYTLFGAPPPDYAHLPVAAVTPGRKLSKQNHATPLNDATPVSNLLRALRFLGQETTDDWLSLPAEDVLTYAIARWERKKVAKQPEIIVDQRESTYYSGP